MLIALDKDTFNRVREHLALGEDSEELDDGEYNVALDDDTEMEIALTEQGIDVLAMVKLAYDEEMKGWYVTEQIEDKAEILRLSQTWLPLMKN